MSSSRVFLQLGHATDDEMLSDRHPRSNLSRCRDRLTFTGEAAVSCKGTHAIRLEENAQDDSVRRRVSRVTTRAMSKLAGTHASNDQMFRAPSVASPIFLSLRPSLSLSRRELRAIVLFPSRGDVALDPESRATRWMHTAASQAPDDVVV